MITVSIISSAVGTIPAAMIAETASDAESTSPNAATETRTASGSARSCSHADGDDAERSFAADERGREVVTRFVDARREDFAAIVHDFEREHVIDRRAVGEAVRTAGIRRDVAADRRDLLRRRIGGVEEPARRDVAREIEVDQAGLHARAPIRARRARAPDSFVQRTE